MDARIERVLRDLKQGLQGLYGDRAKRDYLFGAHARGVAVAQLQALCGLRVWV